MINLNFQFSVYFLPIFVSVYLSSTHIKKNWLTSDQQTSSWKKRYCAENNNHLRWTKMNVQQQQHTEKNLLCIVCIVICFFSNHNQQKYQPTNQPTTIGNNQKYRKHDIRLTAIIMMMIAVFIFISKQNQLNSTQSNTRDVFNCLNKILFMSGLFQDFSFC